MRQRGIGVVHTEGATWRAFLRLWAEHEVTDDELTLALEQVSKGLLTDSVNQKRNPYLP